MSKFNVRGRGDGLLLATLELGFRVLDIHKASAYRIDEEKGFILYLNYKSNKQKSLQKLPILSSPDILFPKIKEFFLEEKKVNSENDAITALLLQYTKQYVVEMKRELFQVMLLL